MRAIFALYSGILEDMMQAFNTPVSVTLHFDHRLRQVQPTLLVWHGREYRIKTLGYHHHYYQGKTLMHVFSVTTATLFFRLVLNTQTLHWRVEQVSDGEVN